MIEYSKMKYSLSLAVILLIMTVIPFFIHSYSPLLCYLFGGIIAFVVLRKWMFGTVGFIAIASCIPAGWAASNITFASVSALSVAFIRLVQYLLPCLFFVLVISEKRKFLKNQLCRLFGGILCCGFVAFVLTQDKLELFQVLIFWGSSYSMYYICNRDVKAKLCDILLLIDVIFIVSGIYAILESIFSWGPYMFITLGLSGNIGEYVGRAKGLLGHPLYLSAFVVVYQSVLFIRYIIYKKFNPFLEIFCLFIALLTVSRTTIIILVIEYVFFLIATKILRNKKVLFFNIIILLFIIFLVDKFAVEYVNDLVERFRYDSVDHRTGAFNTTYNLFLDNPLGVGYHHIMENIRIGNYGVLSFDSYFTTLDNFFLTGVCAYGVFSLLYLYVFIWPLLNAYKLRKLQNEMFISTVLLYLTYFMLSFSFNWEANVFLMFLLFGLCGYLQRNLQT